MAVRARDAARPRRPRLLPIHPGRPVARGPGRAYSLAARTRRQARPAPKAARTRIECGGHPGTEGRDQGTDGA